MATSQCDDDGYCSHQCCFYQYCCHQYCCSGCSLIIVVIHPASAAYTCSADDGFKMTTFSGETVKTFFPCKYHALRRTRCGDYYITLTPGLAEDPQNDRYYAVSTMWASAENVQTGAIWRGRTSNSIANKV